MLADPAAPARWPKRQRWGFGGASSRAGRVDPPHGRLAERLHDPHGAARVLRRPSNRLAELLRQDDIVDDGLSDLVLTLSAVDARAILEASPDRPLALRYCTLSGTCYLVSDILALGPPIGLN